MNNALKIAQKFLLNPSDIDKSKLAKILSNISSPKIDLADIYMQYHHAEKWALEDSIVKTGIFNISSGVGVRVAKNGKIGFAAFDNINFDLLKKASKQARIISDSGNAGSIKIKAKLSKHNLYSNEDPLSSLTEDKKIALLRNVDKKARDLDPRIKHVNASLTGSYDIVLILNESGEMSADVRPLVRFNISVIAEENGRIEQGYSGFGGHTDYQFFLQNNLAEHYTKEAVRIALLNLRAVSVKAGMMPVILGAGWPGVLLHEAIGHGLEADFIRKGSSIYTNKLKTKVATPLCTIVDNGTLPWPQRGSLNIDDEGVSTQCTTLIDKGMLVGFMFDRLNAKLLHKKSTGNGRRESYMHVPKPRMTNTYMLPGKADPKEIIASVKKGIYAVNFAGGQVDITSGNFVFTTSEAYLVKNGKILHPIKDVSLIGNGPTILTKVSMVGNDLQLDHGVGSCGKDGQSVPVSVGQPTLKVDELTVGGICK